MTGGLGGGSPVSGLSGGLPPGAAQGWSPLSGVALADLPVGNVVPAAAPAAARSAGRHAAPESASSGQVTTPVDNGPIDASRLGGGLPSTEFTQLTGASGLLDSLSNLFGDGSSGQLPVAAVRDMSHESGWVVPTDFTPC